MESSIVSTKNQQTVWTFCGISPEKHKGTNKNKKNICDVIQVAGVTANHGQIKWVGGGYLTAADCPDNDPVAFQLHGSQDGV